MNEIGPMNMGNSLTGEVSKYDPINSNSGNGENRSTTIDKATEVGYSSELELMSEDERLIDHQDIEIDNVLDDDDDEEEGGEGEDITEDKTVKSRSVDTSVDLSEEELEEDLTYDSDEEEIIVYDTNGEDRLKDSIDVTGQFAGLGDNEEIFEDNDEEEEIKEESSNLGDNLGEEGEEFEDHYELEEESYIEDKEEETNELDEEFEKEEEEYLKEEYLLESKNLDEQEKHIITAETVTNTNNEDTAKIIELPIYIDIGTEILNLFPSEYELQEEEYQGLRYMFESIDILKPLSIDGFIRHIKSFIKLPNPSESEVIITIHPKLDDIMKLQETNREINGKIKIIEVFKVFNKLWRSTPNSKDLIRFILIKVDISASFKSTFAKLQEISELGVGFDEVKSRLTINQSENKRSFEDTGYDVIDDELDMGNGNEYKKVKY